MTSTFRLTRAEFKKIFKRASVYIMALLLLVAVLISMYLFKPIEKVDNLVSYGENLTVENYYNNFFSSDLPQSKKAIDKSFDNTNSILNYYEINLDRDTKLNQNYIDVVGSFDELKNTNEPTIKEQKYSNLKTNLQSMLNNISNFDDLNLYKHIEFIKNGTTYVKEGNTYKTYKLSDLYLDNYTSSTKSLLNKTTTFNSTQIIETYATNDFKQLLQNEINASIDYIPRTIYILSKDIKDQYDYFNQEFAKGSSNIDRCEITRKNLLNSCKNLKDYLGIVFDNDFPIVLVNKQLKSEVLNQLDNAIENLTSGFTGTTKTISHYKTLNDNLISINLPNYFKSTFDVSKNNVSQVKLKTSTLEEFNKVKQKVESNREELIKVVKKYRSDETIRNIQIKITDYNLLANSYKTYFIDTILLNLSKNYRSTDFANLYNYQLNEFNSYQTQERITANKYYINNNIYSDSFLTNFSFEQNSGKTTNAMDYMYFSMEICTVLITIFAMMLVCNLITQETESGTIKLLLTRPYKRSKIITAKLFATIFFVICFVVFSALISFVGGYFVFGLDSTNILMIFNSTTACVISPLLLMLINIITLTLDIIFYVILALMISIIFKNYAGSISFCFVILLVTYTLNILFSGSFWYSLLPGMNLHLFKYFGNSFASINENSVLKNILITPIQSSMNIVFSFLITCAYSLISLAISYSVFNKRDF